MSHDTDKLIRQLSLVAFLMAERRPLTARDVQQHVEGYSEMSDEAFAVRVYRLDPDYSPELQARLSKLEVAISKQRTVKFQYTAMSTGRERERTLNPYALFNDRGAWYVVGRDLDRDAERTFRVSRIRGDITFATRRERDFRVPGDFEINRYLGRPPWQIGEPEGEARIEVGPDTAWWVERAYGNRGRFEDGVFVTEYSSIPLLATWVLRQEGRAVPLEPEELRREVAEALERVLEAHEGEPPEVAPPAKRKNGDEPPVRPAGPVAPGRVAGLP